MEVTAEDREFFKTMLSELFECYGYTPYDLSRVDKIKAISFEPLRVETLTISATGDDW